MTLLLTSQYVISQSYFKGQATQQETQPQSPPSSCLEVSTLILCPVLLTGQSQVDATTPFGRSGDHGITEEEGENPYQDFFRVNSCLVLWKGSGADDKY